jgi:transcriptional regulator with XRE-family HTH domain
VGTITAKNPAATAVNLHVANRLREMRKLRGISQEKLGEAVGVTFQQVQKYEKGANRLSIGALVQFAEILDVPISYFFDGVVDLTKEATPALDNDALKLVRLWSAIPNPKVRAGIVDLCRAASGEK